MSFLDILHLALRNLRQAKLRAILTTMGVIVGVAVIVTMVSFGLGLQSNMLARFKALDLFNEIQVFGRGLSNLAGLDRPRAPEMKVNDETAAAAPTEPRRAFSTTRASKRSQHSRRCLCRTERQLQRAYVRSNGKLLTQYIGGANIPNASTRFQDFAAGQMISSAQR